MHIIRKRRIKAQPIRPSCIAKSIKRPQHCHRNHPNQRQRPDHPQRTPPPRLAIQPKHHLARSQSNQHRQQKHSRVLRCQRQPRSQSSYQQPTHRPHLAIPVKRIHRRKEETRNANIRRDKSAMRQHSRLKRQQHQSHKRRTNAEHLTRRHKHQQTQPGSPQSPLPSALETSATPRYTPARSQTATRGRRNKPHL